MGQPLSNIPRELSITHQTWGLVSEAERALGRLAGTIELLADPSEVIASYLADQAKACWRLRTINTAEPDLDGIKTGVTDKLRGAELAEAHAGAALFGSERLERDPFSTTLLLKLHEMLFTRTETSSVRAGRIRSKQNWIGARGDGVDNADYVPPPADRLIPLLDDWESYAAESPPIPAVVQCAMLHLQLVNIHPFSDGNGRLAELTSVLFLVQRGRIPGPLLDLRLYFETHWREMGVALGAARGGDPQAWMQFFLQAIAEQATHASREAAAAAAPAVPAESGRPSAGDDMILSIARSDHGLLITNPSAVDVLAILERQGLIQPLGDASARTYRLEERLVRVLAGGTGPAESRPDQPAERSTSEPPVPGAPSR